jgi:hypothetical protein
LLISFSFSLFLFGEAGWFGPFKTLLVYGLE